MTSLMKKRKTNFLFNVMISKAKFASFDNRFLTKISQNFLFQIHTKRKIFIYVDTLICDTKPKEGGGW